MSLPAEFFSDSALRSVPDPVGDYVLKIRAAKGPFEASGAGKLTDLGGGTPDLGLLASDYLRDQMEALSRDRWGRSIYTYGDRQGHAGFRAAAAKEIDSTPDRVVATNGGAHAISTVLGALINAGDRVLVSGPTFALVPAEVKRHGGIAVNVPADQHGVDPNRLQDAIRQYKPKVVFLIPNFDPTGQRMPQSRRDEVAQVIDNATRPVVLVEDLAYNHLPLDGQQVPDITTLLNDQSRGIRAGSYSKIWGERVGFADIGDDGLRKRVITAITTSCMQAPSRHAVVGMFSGTQLQPWQEIVRPAYTARRNALVEAAQESLTEETGLRLRGEPQGGMFGVVDILDRSITPEALFKHALQLGVAVLPGSIFFPPRIGNENHQDNFVRVNFGSVDPDSVRRGTKLLAQAASQLKS